jgi:hypothetical protein
MRSVAQGDALGRRRQAVTYLPVQLSGATSCQRLRGFRSGAVLAHEETYDEADDQSMGERPWQRVHAEPKRLSAACKGISSLLQTV